MGLSLSETWDSLREELLLSYESIRTTKLTPGFFFAVLCVALVIIGNVILLISINFWISLFPSGTTAHQSSQIAIQVVAMLFILFMFSVLGVVFAVVYGSLPLWHVLVDQDRMGSRWYRIALLFASGATNGISSVLGVYAMTYTPQFIQAVLLCCIPFSAQAWTVLLVPVERQRQYLSFFFLGSFIFFIAGVLLSSLSAFLSPSAEGESASWAWALMYILSSILFGLWCVVQRLYLDAATRKPASAQAKAKAGAEEIIVAPEGGPSSSAFQRMEDTEHRCCEPIEVQRVELGEECVRAREEEELCSSRHSVRDPQLSVAAPPGLCGMRGVELLKVEESGTRLYEEMELEDDGMSLFPSTELIANRRWGSQSADDNAAKLVLLIAGLFFQLLISFVLFPVDAIPWFGSSATVAEAWDGFRSAIDFIFASWINVRYGLLYSLGYAMSFIGCTYLNEHSPTLASVVLQLAGPLTSLTIIIIPQWNVYKDSASVGQKVGGVVLLLVAALFYHLWEQQSLRLLLRKANEAAVLEEGEEGERQEEEAEKAEGAPRVSDGVGCERS